MSKLYLEILDPDRKELFTKLVFFRKYGFLAGGTALALQLKHRESVDFDIFLSHPISRQFFRKVVQVFGKNIVTRISTGDLLLIKTPQNIEVHFVYFWYKNLYKPVKTNSIDIAAIGDIAADKAYTIGKRGVWRDYLDIFFLLKRRIFTLEQIIRNAQKKYKPEFNPRLFLEQLSYFGDIHDINMVLLKEKYTDEDVKTFLTKMVKKVSSPVYSY